MPRIRTFPCPYPYAFHFPNRDVFGESKGHAKGVAGYLYANGNIWEDPQVDFRSLDLLNFPLNDFFGSLKLLGCKPDSVALYAKAPFAISESCAFGGASDGDRNDTLVSFDVFDLPRSELVSEPSTQDREGLAGQ